MTTSPLGVYSFLPWLRRGLANQIDPATFEGARATMQVNLEVRGTKIDGSGDATLPVQRRVALFGPGDILGIERRAIIRTEPRNWITNFEPNYLAAIEFYDEDFPWRYTPAAPAGNRLNPWIMLVVLREDEFTPGTNLRNKPLPYIEVTTLDPFPSFDQLWAWAHVHVNRSLIPDDSLISDLPNVFIPQFQAVLAQNPDLGYSRIVSPRKLVEKTGYHAFLMPVFDSGRRAGLGLDPDTVGANDSAWGPDREDSTHFPYYHRWFFQTAVSGDFESLVRLLKPKPADHRVGRRDMDVQRPGINIRGLEDATLQGVLKLGGALRVPEGNFFGDDLTEMRKYEDWASSGFPRDIQEDLAKRINLADDYAQQAAAAANNAAGITDPEDPAHPDPDPVITLPLYGRWPALTSRLEAVPEQPYNWLHELNLDPRFRVAAGFGTKVVQEQQEKYMDAAWEQIGKVIEANRRIRRGQLAKEVSFMWYERHLKPLAAANLEKAVYFLAPVHKRVVAEGSTVYQHQLESFIHPSLTSGATRRILRRAGKLVSTIATTKKPVVPKRSLLDRVNDGEISPTPPKVTPPGVVTPDQMSNDLRETDLGKFIQDLLGRFGNDPLAKCLRQLLEQLERRKEEAFRAIELLREEFRVAGIVRRLPFSSNFQLTPMTECFFPKPGGEDSPEADRFKEALGKAYEMIEVSVKVGTVPPKKSLDLPALVATTLDAINPEVTIPRRVLQGIFLPPRVKAEIGETFVEALAYPVIDQPMYEPLKDISSELFLPNIDLIERDSITLLETNQKFIESYMVGLNHEFARELLWREYPTDQRGSYFRQFWDVKSFFNSTNMNDEDLREFLRDIPKLHLWEKDSELKDHDHREAGGNAEEEIVVVIRGELLKRYPTAVIYAHRARWQMKEDGVTPDNTKERRLVDLTPAEEELPPREIVRTPLYEAKVDPDIYFFGFDLTVVEARGGTGEDPDADDAGWFIVIKERPGEPRFGLDIEKAAPETLNVWADLAWSDVTLAGGFLQPGVPAHTLVAPPDGDEKEEQAADDAGIPWNANISAAETAYVLFQQPVLVGVHASEMLAPPPLGGTP
jgi:hypothetical protein